MKSKTLLDNSLCAIIVLMATLSSCKKDNPPVVVDPPAKVPTAKEVTANINTALAGKDTLSQFAAQVKAVTLTDAEVKDGVTLFAPSNEAYKLKVSSTRRVTATGTSSEYLPDSSLVKDYIVSGKIDITKAQSGTTYTALSGKKLTLTKTGNTWTLNGIFVNTTSVGGGNATIVLSIAGLLNANTVPHVTGTSDIKTFPGWLFTIYGRNLAATVTGNAVKIGGKDAVVHNANADSLVVTVPQGVTNGAITVTVRGHVLTAPQNVTIQQAHVAMLPNTKYGTVQGIAVNDADVLVWTNNYFADIAPSIGTYKAGQPNYYIPSFGNPNADGTHVSNLQNSSLWAITTDHAGNVYYANHKQTNRQPLFVGLWKSKFGAPDSLLRAEWWAGSNVKSANATTKDELQVSTTAMASDKQNNIYFGNFGQVQRITTNGSVSPVITDAQFKAAESTVSKTANIYGITFDARGAMYVSDNGNGRVWVKDATGLRVIAGNSTAGAKDGVGTAAQFGSPFGLTVDKKGNLYVCDNDYMTGKFLIRMINPKGVVTTIAGNGSNTYTDGIGTAAGFNGVNCIVIDSKGVLYVGTDDSGIKKITIN